jgi:hypothetical protein
MKKDPWLRSQLAAIVAESPTYTTLKALQTNLRIQHEVRLNLRTIAYAMQAVLAEGRVVPCPGGYLPAEGGER